MVGNRKIFLAVCYDRMKFSNTAPIIDTDGKAIVLDLSIGSRLRGEEIANLDVDKLGSLIDVTMTDAGTGFAFGRYAEPRDLYNNDHFSGGDAAESRIVHMGIDLFCAAGTPVRAPLAGTVQLLANNARELDYGPMLVLAHEDKQGEAFFTLYGHLGPEVLDNLNVGQRIDASEEIATVGAPPHNGNWPPHLHFQLILDLKDLGADFPGVAMKSEQEYWLSLSPSPAEFFPEREANSLEYS